MNIREKRRRGNQEWTIQKNWQHWVHKTQEEGKQNKNHNTICTNLISNEIFSLAIVGILKDDVYTENLL
jgi:hypothetical protein